MKLNFKDNTMTHHNICDECETVAHCSNHGCIPKQQALDKMAENARELGLDYEPAQQELTNIERHERNVQKFLAEQPAPVQAAYKDSTPHLSVGESSFESWYDQYLLSAPVHQENKQRLRDAYAAGMGDPLVVAAPAQRTWVGLTQEEIDLVWDSVPETQFWWRNYAKVIEVALKEKNT
jgi:hypothetical protein